jgi:VanZ family protein
MDAWESKVADGNRRRRWWRLAAALTLVGMFIGSHGIRFDLLETTVQVGHSAGGLPVDKVVHFSAFSLLTFLVGMGRFLGPSLRRNLLAATIFVCVYGAFDEITQGMMGRDCELSDWLADAMAGWSVLLARWPLTAGGGGIWGSVCRYAVCIGVCIAAPVRAVWSKLHGGPFSRDVIEQQQCFVLVGLVGLACVVMLAGLMVKQPEKGGAA